MIGTTSVLLALSTPPLPPPPYPFDRSIECRLRDFDGRRVATWTGEVAGVETSGSRFQMVLESDQPAYRVPEVVVIPNGASSFVFERPGNTPAVDLKNWDPHSLLRQARLSYEVELPNEWHGKWLVNVKNQSQPIATGLCLLRVQIRNEAIEAETSQ